MNWYGIAEVFRSRVSQRFVYEFENLIIDKFSYYGLLSNSCEKFERDVKQKRLLIEDYQKKLRMAKEAASADRGKMVSFIGLNFLLSTVVDKMVFIISRCI